MPDMSDALFKDRCGTIIALEITAGAMTDSFPSGYNEWRKTISCRVTAPAFEGRANLAVIALVSGMLGVPASQVSIQSGTTSPQKRVLVEGMNKKDLLARILEIGGI